MTKVHVFYEPLEGPWGGGNQFLKALKKIFTEKGVHVPLEEAQAVLVNSHHFANSVNLSRLLDFLKDNPQVALIHRVDGPVTLIRERNDGTDDLIFKFNDQFSDGTIFQSHWCYENCLKLGFRDGKPHRIIFNAPDPQIFYPPQAREITKKIRIVATSWSPSAGKGFSTYQWMDKNLDWHRYEMTFVGNSPVPFENIKHIPPLPSHELADVLRDHDIFITASRNDPCSNSLIEALHCGLPALVYQDGGHPEIIGKGGLTFVCNEDVPQQLDKISTDLGAFISKIDLPDMQKIAQDYLDFMKETHEKTEKRTIRSQKWEGDKFVSLYKKKYESFSFRKTVMKTLVQIKKKVAR